MQSLSSQAKTVWCSEWGKAFVSLRAIWFPFLFLEKQDFKKVMLILAVFSWRKGRCVFIYLFIFLLLKDAETIKADFWQFTWMHRGIQPGVNGRDMLHLHMLLSLVTECSTET